MLVNGQKGNTRKTNFFMKIVKAKKKLNKLGVENNLWNNIRANKGSGKKPTAEMLKQEKKIKKES